MEEMSESEPSRTHRYCLKVLSKPGLTIGSGISWDEACLRTQRQPVYMHQLEGVVTLQDVLNEYGVDCISGLSDSSH
jgi:hypothetical protein